MPKHRKVEVKVARHAQRHKVFHLARARRVAKIRKKLDAEAHVEWAQGLVVPIRNTH